MLAPAFLSLPAHAGPLLPAVGPDTHTDKVSTGYLRVYSRTEQTQWGENTYYNVHSAYWIYNHAGQQIKTVANHDTSIDESPATVSLTPGSYFVKAWSDDDGLVTVPVIIKLAQTTTVRLEAGSPETTAHVTVGRPS
ncbi:MAG: hypothetical protein WDO13_16560 [Verrucomicrobiota bacterium]